MSKEIATAFEIQPGQLLDPSDRSFDPNAVMAVNSYRNNSVLRYDEWKDYDKTVIQVAQKRLRAVSDLMTRGLVYRPGNGLGATVLQWEDISDITGASMSMDGLTRGQNDRPNYQMRYLPLPIVHKDWQINERVLQASRQSGSNLDTTTAALATRKVADYIEDMLINGSGNYQYGSGTIYGYCTAPFRIQRTINNAVGGSAAFQGWIELVALGATGHRELVRQVIGWKQDLVNNHQYGPYVMYVPTSYDQILDEDYLGASGGSDITIRERLLKIDGIMDIKVLDHLKAVTATGELVESGTVDSAERVIIVSLDIETVRMVEAMPLTNMMWDLEGKWLHIFKVATINVPNLRTDQEGNSGLLVAQEPTA